MRYINDISSILRVLGVPVETQGGASNGLEVCVSIDGTIPASLAKTSPEALATSIDQTHQRFLNWRDIPTPKRG